jgi:hypothetical protein
MFSDVLGYFLQQHPYNMFTLNHCITGSVEQCHKTGCSVEYAILIAAPPRVARLPRLLNSKMLNTVMSAMQLHNYVQLKLDQLCWKGAVQKFGSWYQNNANELVYGAELWLHKD